MKISKLQYITQGASEAEILNEIESVLDAGCDWVQLRIKDERVDFLTVAKKASAICEHKAVFIVNDNVEIAKLVNADGVHLGLEDMSIQKARQILGENKIIGGTANTKKDCLQRQNDGADYIGLGPFRMTTTKKKLSPILGLAGYQSILPKNQHEIRIPVLAIGGIGLDDVPLLKHETAVHGIAVSGLIANASSKSNLIAEINSQLE